MIDPIAAGPIDFSPFGEKTTGKHLAVSDGALRIAQGLEATRCNGSHDNYGAWSL